MTDGPSSRLMWIWVIAGSALSLVVSAVIAGQTLEIGSSAGGWFYPYVRSFGWDVVRVIAAAAAAAAAIATLAHAARDRGEWWPVVIWLAGGVALQWWLRSLAPSALGDIFASETANSFNTVARHYEPMTALGRFLDVRGEWPIHAASNMPGKLMLVYALRLITRRPAMLAWVVIALSNAGGALMYVFVRDLTADRRAALTALALYLILPAKLVFFPLLNVVTPVLVLACGWLVLRSLRSGGALYPALSGAAIYALAFFEPTPLVLGLPLVAALTSAIVRAENRWRFWLRQAGWAAAGFAAVYALMRGIVGFDLIGAARAVASDALRFNREAGRPYGIWVGRNLIDFLVGAGVCQAVVAAGALVAGVPAVWKRRTLDPLSLLGVGLPVVLLALDLVGTNRGEVIRLWIFLACVFQIPTAIVCARLRSPTAVALVVLTTLVQGAIAASMIGFVVV